MSFLVRSFEIDGRYRALPRTLTNYLQELAVQHAHDLGVARGQLDEGLTWMLSRLRIEMQGWPRWRDELTLRTWPSGLERLFALRDYEIGPGLGVATSAWLVVDERKRRPMRLPAYVQKLREVEPERALVGFEPLPDLVAAEHERRFHVRWSECDMNGHANQSSYLDWAINALPGAFLDAHVPRTLEIEFRAEAYPDDAVLSRCGGGVHTLVREADGVELARLRIGWEPDA